MNIAILWSDLSGYMNACLKALARTDGVKLFVASRAVQGEAPFNESIFSWMENRYQWTSSVNTSELLQQLVQFKPDVVLASGWHNLGYRKALKYFEGQSVRILGMDNQWHGTPKQWLGVMTSPLYIHKICDALFVPGERQVVFAKQLGFKQECILRGVYSCDHESFSKIYFERKSQLFEDQSFIFVGRFVRNKGVEVLVDAYKRYREAAVDPWPLKCYGTGPLANLLADIDGIEVKGFCQPCDLPEELAKASCMVLPSLFEAWGVVVHEAVASGLSVISSDSVGASVHLVQDGYNGYITQTGDAVELSKAMLRYSILTQSERSIMAENSFAMSLQFTPERWTKALLSRACELATKKGLKFDVSPVCPN